MNPRIKDVHVDEIHLLTLTFDNGEVRCFDMRPYLTYPVFQALQNPAFFKLAKPGHGTVTWPQDIDFDPDILYLDSVPIRQDKAA